MKKIALILFGIIAANASPSADAAAATLKLKTESSFSGAQNARDPFWPIGHVKRMRNETAASSAAEASVPVMELKPENFVVSSILIVASQRLAIINAKSYAEGESVLVNAGSQKLGVKLAAIRDGEVVLTYLDKTLNVPLRRKELAGVHNGAALLPVK